MYADNKSAEVFFPVGPFGHRGWVGVDQLRAGWCFAARTRVLVIYPGYAAHAVVVGDVLPGDLSAEVCFTPSGHRAWVGADQLRPSRV